MGNKYLVLFALVLWNAQCQQKPERRQVFGFRVGGMRKPPEEPPVEKLVPVKVGVTGEGFFPQLTDHFGTLNTTWNQHYYFNYAFNANYVGLSNNVAFLMLGGEGPESSTWTRRLDIPYMQWAASHKAAVFDLEHRFYGQSRPFETLTVDNLKYLSSRQALEDIAYFINYINTQNKWTGTKWVVFGGSYSGALAAWFRQLYPNVAVGAVGSSGPVQATVDFYQYLQVVENSLSYNGTSNAAGWTFGSPQCLAAVKDGFSQVISLMQSAEGRDYLTTIFKLTPPLNNLPLNDNDIFTFYSTIFGNFQGAVQYSNDGGKDRAGGIADVCDMMLSANSTLDGLRIVNQYFNTDSHGNFYGTDISYDDLIQWVRQENYTDAASTRCWLWQTCTEFGYYQSTDYTQGVFGMTSPLTADINMCMDIYGSTYNADFVKAAVDKTNAFYGGAAGYSGSNVLLPNGDLDPWHALGRLTSDFYSQTTYLINGSAHCGDMYPVSDGDHRYDIVHALAARHINNWINGPPEASERKSSEPKTDRLSAKFPSVPKMFEPVITDLGKKLDIENDEFKYMPLSRKYAILRTRPRPLAPDMDLSTADLDGYSAFTFTQPLCHFNNEIPNTFQQRWWKNTKWARPGGPNFLMIGGEGPANPQKWVLNENITYLQLAAQYGATVYYMEHRCYGESHDLGNSTYKTDYVMLFCNSWQSLWDIKLFIETVNYRENNIAPWITFGGSYSGMLALWSRYKFPNLITGAVGSSAPIYIKLDFYEYFTVTENSFKMYDPNCESIIQNGLTQARKLLLTPQGRKNFSDIFTLSAPWNESSNPSQLDIAFTISNIYGSFQGAVQYAGDNTAWYANNEGDIGGMCAVLNNYSSDPLLAVAKANQYMTTYYLQPGETFSTYNNYTDFVIAMKQLSAGADRTWTYQTCVEFGFFQSTDSGYTIFGSAIPVNIYLQMCLDIFGDHADGNIIEGSDYSTKQIQSDINDHFNFFTANYNATNIAAPNGNVDPWHALGLLTATTNGQTIIPINATAHCADMYPARDSDPQSLKDARTMISNLIASWLPAPTTSTNSNSTYATSTTTTRSNPTSTTSTTILNSCMYASICSFLMILLSQ